MMQTLSLVTVRRWQDSFPGKINRGADIYIGDELILSVSKLGDDQPRLGTYNPIKRISFEDIPALCEALQVAETIGRELAALA